MIEAISNYRSLLNKAMGELVVTDGIGKELGGFAESVEAVAKEAFSCDVRGGEIIFIGNGGSAAICEHCAIDWWKNGKVKTRVLYGNSQLTCLANE